MKTESVTMPVSSYEIEFEGEYVNVLFFENVESISTEPEDVQRYQYDLYRIEGLKNRPSLIDAIERGINGWLNMAKEKEYKKLTDAIRSKRNDLLAETDWTQTADTPLIEDEIKMYRVYRQALRDIPAQGGFPYDVEWPVFG